VAPWALDAFVNKTVDSRFCGRDSLFHLSQGLFSSFDIDDGTRLLLKSIAQRLDLDRLRSCLDVGCGVGAIGVSVKSRAAQATVVMQDRDALAVAFAEENSRANGQPDAEVDCGLAFWHLGGRTFDLVASNLPAKAGAPVLEAFIRLAPSFLTPQGVVAVVIVAPLADFATAAIKSLGHELAYSESTKGYTVLHFRAGGGGSSGNGGSGAREKSAESLEPYIRHKGAFTRSGHTYELTTAWSLPDFDTVGHGLDLAMEVLSEVTLKGEALFWNPGQGHVPACLVSNLSNAFSGISLAARDFLELAMTERNLRDCGRPPRVTKPVPS
jgi:predicted RNA methylase